MTEQCQSSTETRINKDIQDPAVRVSRALCCCLSVQGANGRDGGREACTAGDGENTSNKEMHAGLGAYDHGHGATAVDICESRAGTGEREVKGFTDEFEDQV